MGFKNWLIAGCMTVPIAGCGNDDSDKETGQAQAGFDNNGFATGGTTTGKARISMIATAKSSSIAGLTADPDPNDLYFNLESVLSGPADEMVLNVKAMNLAGDGVAEMPIFKSEEGRPLRIRGTTIDMSNFFTEIKCMNAEGDVLEEECPCGLDAEGEIIEQVDVVDPNTGEKVLGCPMLTEEQMSPVAFFPVPQEGVYNKLRVEFDSVAQVMGCAEGYVRQDGWTLGAWNENVEFERYCTKAGKGLGEIEGDGFASSDFLTPTAAAEWSALPLTGTSGDEALNIDYAIKDGFDLGAGDEPQITMVIDTSRALSFYKADNAAGKDLSEVKAKGSFFFTYLFQNNNFIFLGRPGTVKGYKYYASALRPDEAPAGYEDDPSVLACAFADCFKFSTGWLSVIFDADEQPYVVNLQADDGSVGVKGANRSEVGVNPEAVVETDTAGVFEFSPNALGGGNVSITTEVFGIDLREAVQVGDAFNAYYLSEIEEGGSTGYEHGALKLERAL